MARTKSVVPVLSGANNIKAWAKGHLVISVTSKVCSEGYSLDFWVSANKALMGRLALVAGFTTSLNARSLEASLEQGSKMFEKIIDLVSLGRVEAISATMDNDTKGIVGLAHIKAHRQIEQNSNPKTQTLMEVNFLVKELDYKYAPLLALAKMDKITISQMRNRVYGGSK
jgi:hypothetical protein